MSNIVLLVVVVLVAWLVVATIRRRRHGLVAERGTSIGADLGTMRDQPRVRVRAVTTTGPGRAHLLLAPDSGGSEVDLDVFLDQDEVGFELLQEWSQRQCPLAIVSLPGNELVRLRNVDDLQPLTLRRVTD